MSGREEGASGFQTPETEAPVLLRAFFRVLPWLLLMSDWVGLDPVFSRHKRGTVAYLPNVHRRQMDKATDS